LTLRVGLAGAGMVSGHHLLGWSRCRIADVVAIADPDEESLARRAEAFGIMRTFSSVEEMLSAGGIDAVDVATPLRTHAAVVEAAVRRGLPVLCQKPLGATAAEARAIAALAEAHGVRLMVHENWRFRPHYRTIRQWIDQGRIGRPRAFQLSSLGSGLLARGEAPPPALERQPFLATMDRLILLELLIHHFDTLAFLFGPLRLEAAHAATLSPFVLGEDTATLALRGDGASGSIFASMAASGAPVRVEDRLEVLGEGGRILLENASLNVDGSRPARLVVDREADYQRSYDNTVAHFAAALHDGSAFETPPEVHLRALDLVEEDYRRTELVPAR